ncbi:branched-chain amino acid ABC transporter permease [Halobaculum magnesiiphilum]|uniref:Branched-chain amino acid ABC transporter permease n=1 Tax=Halobaculum magnesiiphilum TaxID=1017351 RepID=A0A8T8WA29_9EURY|nr:branched-chain amino acid ABC transporter permease [Halobaculum magnesiiphilum]QZP36709.1 branched-chain amino acid ABC transporter permease [Halobaculum magnesiiphilum]
MSVLEYLANGLVFSSIIVLSSIGLSLVYSIANFANFAHGDTMTVGAYTALVTFGFVGSLGAEVLGLPLGFFLALVVGVAVAAAVAVLTHKIVYEPLDVGSIGLLITSIGVAFVYRAIVQLGFGTGFLEFQIPLLRPIDALLPFGIRMTLHDVAIVASAVVLVAGLHALLQYTDLGRKMRATADNPSLARVSGIRTDRIEIWTWVIGAGLAGAGGVFLGLYSNISPRMGFNILLVVFAAVILGGIGSVYGAMAGGFLIGMINQLTPILPRLGQEIPFLPERFGIPIGIEYANAIAFLIMVAVLLVRPSGIAGEEAV